MFNTTDLNFDFYSIKKFGLFTSTAVMSPDITNMKHTLDYQLQFTLDISGCIRQILQAA